MPLLEMGSSTSVLILKHLYILALFNYDVLFLNIILNSVRQYFSCFLKTYTNEWNIYVGYFLLDSYHGYSCFIKLIG